MRNWEEKVSIDLRLGHLLTLFYKRREKGKRLSFEVSLVVCVHVVGSLQWPPNSQSASEIWGGVAGSLTKWGWWWWWWFITIWFILWYFSCSLPLFSLKFRYCEENVESQSLRKEWGKRYYGNVFVVCARPNNHFFFFFFFAYFSSQKYLLERERTTDDGRRQTCLLFVCLFVCLFAQYRRKVILNWEESPSELKHITSWRKRKQ